MTFVKKLCLFLTAIICFIPFSVSAKTKMVVIGDSYTCGLPGVNYDGTREKSLKKWVEYMSEDLDMRSSILVVGGAGYGFCRRGKRFISLLDGLSYDSNVDAVLVVGGATNDRFTNLLADNSYSPSTATQTKNAMIKFENMAKSKFPNATIVYSAPNYGVGVERHNLCTQRALMYKNIVKSLGWQYLYKTENVLKTAPEKTIFYKDGVHPNSKGHEILGHAMASAMRYYAPFAVHSETTVDNDVPDSANETELRSNTILLPKMSTIKSDSIRLVWNRIEGAVKYTIHGNLIQCKMKKIGTTTSLKTTRENLKPDRVYKFIIRAWDENGQMIAESREIHISTPHISSSKTKYTNCKSVTATPSVTLKKKLSFPLSKKETPMKVGKPMYSGNNSGFVYVSDTPLVATVNEDGIVYGKNTGKCKIYTISQSGAYAATQVTVK